MKRPKLVIMGAITIVALASGCNGTITQPMQNEGTMSAYFSDNTEFLAQTGTTFSVQNGTSYFVYAQDNVTNDQTNNGDEVTLLIPIESSVPYTVAGPPDNTADVGYHDYETNEQYDGNSAVGFCSITVTQTSPTLVGSFQSVTISTLGDTVALSSGSFNAVPQ